MWPGGGLELCSAGDELGRIYYKLWGMQLESIDFITARNERIKKRQFEVLMDTLGYLAFLYLGIAQSALWALTNPRDSARRHFLPWSSSFQARSSSALANFPCPLLHHSNESDAD